MERIHDLPDENRLPQDIQDDLKKYSRSQNSEKAIVRLTDYQVSAVKQVLSALLQDLDGNLPAIVNTLLREIRINDETLKYMSGETRLKIKLNDYISKNLSKYLEVETGTSTDVPMEQLQKDLSEIFMDENQEVVGNIFEPLFHSFLPEEKIKLFLATTDPIKPLHIQISKFIDNHRFDLIEELFEKGFRPTSSQDWKDVLPQEYYDRFPPAMWKLTDWTQFVPFVELSKKYSLSIHNFIKYAFYKDNERLIRLGHEIRDKNRANSIRPSKHAPFINIFDEAETVLLQRTKPWVEGLVCVLIKPVKNCELYTSKPYGKYFFTTDALYKDLANSQYKCEQDKNSRVFSVKYLGFHSEFYVYHLLRNGQIVPQTFQVYEKGLLYMSTERPQLRIPKVEEYFLSLPFDNLSSPDQDFFLNIFKADISFFLTTIYDDTLDFDGMASVIVSGMMDKIETSSLKTCLEHAFHVYFLFDPRYNMNLLSNVAKERMNLFFYNLDNIDELPIDFYYPQYAFLGEEKQKSFERWHDRCMNGFIIEKLSYLFTKNYPVLRVKMPENNASSFPPKTILLGIETGEKIPLLHPYNNQYIYLPEVAGSIIQGQEYMVNGKPLSIDALSSIEKFLDLERVRAGLGSYLMDNDFEISVSTIRPHTETIIHEEEELVETNHMETLPDFKEKAYGFLEMLSAV
jgi:hypothetical protein